MSIEHNMVNSVESNAFSFTITDKSSTSNTEIYIAIEVLFREVIGSGVEYGVVYSLL
jgi:hypothetical protein